MMNGKPEFVLWYLTRIAPPPRRSKCREKDPNTDDVLAMFGVLAKHDVIPQHVSTSPRYETNDVCAYYVARQR